MQLDSLILKNFRAFTDSQFDFDPSLNLIVGINGSGKSTLLSAIRAVISDALRPVTSGFKNHGIAVTDVRFQTELIGHRVRFERLYPCSLAAEGSIFGQRLSWSVVRNSEVKDPDIATPIFQPFARRKESLGNGAQQPLPLIAFYSAQRSGKGSRASLEDAASAKTSRLDGYKSWDDAFSNRTDFETWVLGKTLENIQLVAEESAPLSLDDDELQIVNRALHDCIPESRDLRYDLRLRSLMVEFASGEAVPFASLSDGQQGMFLLVGDIARRLCMLNPHLGADVLTKSTGILAIDELDIHLHPGWQRRIISVLRRVFPQLQIFASTHSPQMLGVVRPHEIIILNNGKSGEPQASFGLDASQILEGIMDTPSREPSIEAALGRLFSSLERNDFVAAKEQLSQLRQDAPGIPDYSRVDALLRRKETIGR